MFNSLPVDILLACMTVFLAIMFFHYICKGNVDNSCDTSHGGSYTGIEQMGFLWSMIQAPGQRKGLRLMKKDVTKPYTIQLNCFDGHLAPDEGFVNSLTKTSLKPLTSTTMQKWYMSERVKRVEVREGRVRGTLFIPPGNGPFPGNLLLLIRLFFINTVEP